MFVGCTNWSDKNHIWNNIHLVHDDWCHLLVSKHHSFLFVHCPHCRCPVLIGLCSFMSPSSGSSFSIGTQFIIIFGNLPPVIHWTWPYQHNYFLSIVSVIISIQFNLFGLFSNYYFSWVASPVLQPPTWRTRDNILIFLPPDWFLLPLADEYGPPIVGYS
jgi:hypothetical protein